MIDTCHSHLVANDNSLQEKGGSSIPLALGSTLININGGHSEGYIRNAGLGSVPKIAKLAYIIYVMQTTSRPPFLCATEEGYLQD